MCVPHRGLRFGVSQPVQPHRHGRIDLIEQRGIAMPESMKAALLYAQLFQERMKLPLAYQAMVFFWARRHPYLRRVRSMSSEAHRK